MAPSEWVVLEGSLVPLYVPPPAWEAGEEKAWHHTLVEADPEAVEQLWQIRSQPARLAEFILDRGATYFKAKLAERFAVDEAVFAPVVAYLEASLPELRRSWRDLDRHAVPTLAWSRVAGCVKECRELARLIAANPDSENAHGVAHFLRGRHRYLAKLATALSSPDHAGFGARYDSRRALMEDAVTFAARRPLHDLGLGEEVGNLSSAARRVLSRRASPRALIGHETYWLLTPTDAAQLAERLGTAPADEVAGPTTQRLVSALTAIQGPYLMATTQWIDYGLASGVDLDPMDLQGVFKTLTDR